MPRCPMKGKFFAAGFTVAGTTARDPNAVRLTSSSFALRRALAAIDRTGHCRILNKLFGDGADQRGRRLRR